MQPLLQSGMSLSSRAVPPTQVSQNSPKRRAEIVFRSIPFPYLTLSSFNYLEGGFLLGRLSTSNRICLNPNLLQYTNSHFFTWTAKNILMTVGHVCPSRLYLSKFFASHSKGNVNLQQTTKGPEGKQTYSSTLTLTWGRMVGVVNVTLLRHQPGQQNPY